MLKNTGAGEWNRTTDLRFTNQWKGDAQVVEDLGIPRPWRYQSEPASSLPLSWIHFSSA